MEVSVVIAARNAVATLGETLESLRAQTFEEWEAVVVDDGSTDETPSVAEAFAARDPRIRLIRGTPSGVSAARNAGIAEARFPWLLLFDADDWLDPAHLERMTSVLRAEPDLDAVHCGCARITPGGVVAGELYGPRSRDLFPAFARTCVFAAHACVVRRGLVRAVGGFDRSLQVCEDWDLWQRVARAGARFGSVREALALYRMRPGSASSDGRRLLEGALRVIERGHSPDPRVPNPRPEYVQGMPREELPRIRLHMTAWAAGLVLGSGADACHLLDLLDGDRDPALDPAEVAESLFESVPLAGCRTQDEWPELLAAHGDRIGRFLTALEGQSCAALLAARISRALERLVLARVAPPGPAVVGTTPVVELELTQRLADVTAPDATRIFGAVRLEGEAVGSVELPVCDGLVPGAVLADAVAAELAWTILGRFFAGAAYGELRTELEDEGVSVWRGPLRLAQRLQPGAAGLPASLHDRIGWSVFLQELWGRPDWPDTRFYEPEWEEEPARRHRAGGDRLVVEVSEELPDVDVSGGSLVVLPTVGGAPLGLIPVPAPSPYVRAQAVRVAITVAAGLELVRAAVREGVLGRPLRDSRSLRERLREAAAEGSAWAGPLEPGLVLGRRSPNLIGTSASRRAALPARAAKALAEAAALAGEPARSGGKESATERILYVPELIGRDSPGKDSRVGRERSRHPVATASAYGREYFESLFARRPDPWRYTSPYEQTKYEQTPRADSAPRRPRPRVGLRRGALHRPARAARSQPDRRRQLGGRPRPGP